MRYCLKPEKGGFPVWMEKIVLLNDMVRAFVWGVPMLVLLVGTGVYFTAKTRLFQLRHIGLWLRRTLFSCFTGEARRKSSGQAVSPFATMCTALAATVGTGNIAGVATALTIGGPMLYLKKGLHSPFLAGAFALSCALASFGMGNMSQCNSIASGLSGVFGVPESVTGLVTAALLGVVMLGGLRRISRVTETLVPFMALFYMGGALTVLWCCRADLPQACGQILAAAFDWKAGAGGAVGYGMMQAIRIGVSRGVFSNEAGLGSSVMVHTAADAKEPCEQGMWAVFEVFFDTIVMCTVTALVLLASGVYDETLYGLAAGTPLMQTLATGAQLTAAAFSTVFGPLGGGFVAVSLVLFAFSTLLGWSYYGQRAVEYLFGARAVPVYKALFVAAAAVGCTMRLDLAWALSDTFNGLMALPNLVGVLALRREVLREWRRYRRADHI